MAPKISLSESKKYSYMDLFKSLWFFLGKHKAHFLFWVTTLFIIRFFELVPPIIISKITDFFTQYHPGQSLQPFYLLIAFLGISYALASIIRATAKNKMGDLEAETVYTAKVTGFERLLDFSLKWHDAENTGNKVQKIMNGTAAFRDFKKIVNNEGFSSTTSIIGIIVIFAFLKPLFIVFVVIYMVAFIIMQTYYNKKIQAITDKSNKAIEQASGTYYEGLNNVLTLKTLGAKDSFKANVFDNEDISRQLKKDRFKLAFTKIKIFQVFNAAAISIYLLMVGQGVLDKSFSVGTIFIFYSYLLRLIDSTWEITDVVDELIEIKVAVMRMMPIYKDDQKLRTGTKPFPYDWKKLSIQNATFSHKNHLQEDDEVFKMEDLSFSINKFEKVGIVGQSGSGKSTLAKILLGLYEFEKGTFKIDETNFYDLENNEVTHNLAIVLQDSEMFNLSLKDNITMLKENPEQLALAIKVSQLEELIERLPDGIDTLIGEKGYRLSGGERQRIGMARAIFKNPQIFVFDEATSSLDSKTENLIQEALEKELQKKTMIIIAHRLSTLKNVDRIYVFENGAVIEEGRYDDLMANPSSKFYQLHLFQSKQFHSSHGGDKPPEVE
ncbi:MAG: ABC transporter ATP-binding protein [Patescibacteria group bacterium]